jgi:hypothetical protein
MGPVPEDGDAHAGHLSLRVLFIKAKPFGTVARVQMVCQGS